MTEASTIGDKIKEIIAEMKRQGIWQKEIPEWVTDYEKKIINDQQDFAGWLQFVYLPNRLQGGKTRKNLIVPQAKKFFSEDMRRGKLLRLLVELDALI